MNTNVKGFLVLILAFLVQTALAQEQTITGTVTDNHGVPLPAVNITIENAPGGTSTDFDGNYSIEAAKGQVLVFSTIGFEQIKKTVGDDTVINVSLQEGTALDEVVVTALGVSREKRSLGYATQEVSSENLNTVTTTNFSNALSGKVSGVDIRRNNNFGGSTNVVIRGNASITGNNQALFVIDGVPISNRNTNSADQQQAIGGSYDYGNAAADIDPEQIESINVLKGAAATALYGSRAANGVILITTKKGDKSMGLGVTINSSVEVGFIDKKTFPKYQNEYGGGYGGELFTHTVDIDGDGVNDLVSNYDDDASYGPKFDPNKLVYQWDAFIPGSPTFMTPTPWVAAKNTPLKFFEKPVTLTNSISVANGLEEGSYRISFSNQNLDGIMPNMESNKNDVRFSGNYNLNDKLSINGFANYIKTDTKGRNSTGYNDNVVTMFRQWWQTNVDVLEQRDMYRLTGTNATWNPSSETPGVPPLFWDNPYWVRHENYQNDTRSRFIGKLELNYELTDWFSVMGRVATDTYNELQEERKAVGSVPGRFGVTRGTQGSGYLRRDITTYETNYDLLLNFDTDFSDKIHFNGLLGGNIRRNEFNQVFQSTQGGLLVANLYSLQNSVDPNPRPVENFERIGVNGIFGSVSFGYDKTLYLDATLRRDQVSNLPKSHNSFWYPSLTTSFVFSQLLNTRQTLSFGKLRVNYAEVGNGAPFDRIHDTYVINNDIGTSVPIRHNNPNLKPERTKSFEAGLEMQFWQNRLGFDFAYYNTNSVDQIVEAPVSNASGYATKLLNAGKIRNEGFELSVNGSPIKTDDFNWNVNVNWTKNESKVVSLPEGTQNLQLGSYQGGVTIGATVGEPFGTIRGSDYEYDNDGNRIVDDEGHYKITSTSNNVIGDMNPQWKMGVNNSLNYKNFTFNFLIDIQHGGNIFTLDQYYGESTGLYPMTAGLNDRGNPVRAPLSEGGGILNDGVKENGQVNDTYIDASEFGAFGYQEHPNSAFVYSASYVKLREVGLTYALPKSLLENTFLSGVQFSLTGSNLWIIHKRIPYADPEAGLSSGNLQGYMAGALPTTKNVAFNVRLQF